MGGRVSGFGLVTTSPSKTVRQPSLELWGRQDAGDDVGGGIRWTNPPRREEDTARGKFARSGSQSETRLCPA
jgi:hypothetical protein